MSRTQAPVGRRARVSRRPVPRAGAAVALFLVTAGCGSTHGSGLTAYANGTGGRLLAPNRRVSAPPVTGTTLTGRRFALADFRGAPVVVNFWGSWCAPCKAEQPELEQLAVDTARTGVHFLGVDVRDTVPNALAHVRRYHVSYPSLSDPADRIAALFGPAAPRAVPSTLLIDGRGRIAALFLGRTTYLQLVALVRELVSEDSG